MFFFLMIRRPPRSTRTDTTLSLHDALPISDVTGARPHGGGGGKRDRPRHLTGEQGDIAARIFMVVRAGEAERSEEHTSELQSLMRISYAVFCLKKKKKSACVRTLRHMSNSHSHTITLML